MGRQVNLAVGVPVEDARAFVVKVDDGLGVVFVLKERLVRSDNLCVFL